MNRPTLVSLFSGAGGLDLGLEQAGFETILANDIEPYASESLRANQMLHSFEPSQFDRWFDRQIADQRCYRNLPLAELTRLRLRLQTAINGETYLKQAHIIESDVRNVRGEDILAITALRRGEIDLIAGGPPCQPFSRAGKREVVESDTGQLFRDFVRLVADLNPRWFLFENVKGLVIHKADVASRRCPSCLNVEIVAFEMRNAIREAGTMIATCETCGYYGSQAVLWQNRRSGSLDIILNAFERIGYHCTSTILDAADFGAPQRRERLFIVGSRDAEKFLWPQPTHVVRAGKQSETITLFDPPQAKRKPWESLSRTPYAEGHWRYGTLDPAKAVLWVKNIVRPHDEPVTWMLDRPAPTIGAHQAAKLAIAPMGVPEDQLRRQQWHVLGRRQGDTPPVFVEHEYLTDEELLKLQTFPTSWYLHGTRMQRAFQIGNAVPPVLARAVGRSIISAMGAGAIDPALSTRNVHEHSHYSSI